MNKGQEIFLLTAKSPLLGYGIDGYADYITTSQEFKEFTHSVVDLELMEEGVVNTEYAQYVKTFSKVEKIAEMEHEDRAIQGLVKTVKTSKGKVKIGYSRVRENRIYVAGNNRYYRGIRVFFADLCLVNAMDFVPLDKSIGFGNIEILKWNKRTSTKAIKFIHNKIQSILYVVDMEFDTETAMLEDIDNPKDLNLVPIIEPLL